MQRTTLRVLATLIFSAIIMLSVSGLALAAPVPNSELLPRQTGPYALANGAINVRGGPGVGFWILGYLASGEIVPITGVSPDGAWWYVDTTFGPGWVAGISVTAYNTELVEEYDPGLIGAVSAGALHVRSSAGSMAPTVGQLSRDQQVFILAQSTDSNWFQVQWAYGTGWVARAYIVTTGFAGQLPDEAEVPLTGDLPYGEVTATYLNVRSGPGLNYSIIGYVYGGEILSIVGRTADSLWYEVETRFGTGWVYSTFLATRNEYGGSPITSGMAADAEIVGPTGVVNTGAAYLRTGPGPQYTSLGVLAGGQEGQIFGRNADWSWWLMQTDLGTGWVYAPLIVVRGEQSSVPFVEPGTTYAAPTAATGLGDGQGGFEEGAVIDAPETEAGAPPAAVIANPRAVVNTGALNIRSGPNSAFSSLGSVYAGTELEIIGQSPDRGWWLVISPYGNGWATKALTLVRGDASNVPVVQ